MTSISYTALSHTHLFTFFSHFFRPTHFLISSHFIISFHIFPFFSAHTFSPFSLSHFFRPTHLTFFSHLSSFLNHWIKSDQLFWWSYWFKLTDESELALNCLLFKLSVSCLSVVHFISVEFLQPYSISRSRSRSGRGRLGSDWAPVVQLVPPMLPQKHNMLDPENFKSFSYNCAYRVKRLWGRI